MFHVPVEAGQLVPCNLAELCLMSPTKSIDILFVLLVVAFAVLRHSIGTCGRFGSLRFYPCSFYEVTEIFIVTRGPRRTKRNFTLTDLERSRVNIRVVSVFASARC
jgi:hypothetical protein